MVHEELGEDLCVDLSLVDLEVADEGEGGVGGQELVDLHLEEGELFGGLLLELLFAAADQRLEFALELRE